MQRELCEWGLPDPGDQTPPLPEFAVVPIHHSLRDLNSSLVVVGFDPNGRRDLIDPVEAIKPVVRHAPKPKVPSGRRSAD